MCVCVCWYSRFVGTPQAENKRNFNRPNPNPTVGVSLTCEPHPHHVIQIILWHHHLFDVESNRFVNNSQAEIYEKHEEREKNMRQWPGPRPTYTMNDIFVCVDQYGRIVCMLDSFQNSIRLITYELCEQRYEWERTGLLSCGRLVAF